MNNLEPRKINILLLTTIVLLLVAGFWGKILGLALTSSILLDFYPQLFATIIGVALGVPTGLFINSLTEKGKDRKILTSILIFIKTELVSNQKNIENLQSAAETVYLLQNIGQDDLRALSKFTMILSKESYIAAQSSVAFASIGSDKLMSNIVNAYLNTQRIVSGVMALEEVDPNEGKVLLISYIKLCERAKESIRFCLLEIDNELKRLGNTITILD